MKSSHFIPCESQVIWKRDSHHHLETGFPASLEPAAGQAGQAAPRQPRPPPIVIMKRYRGFRS